MSRFDDITGQRGNIEEAIAAVENWGTDNRYDDDAPPSDWLSPGEYMDVEGEFCFIDEGAGALAA